MTNKQPSNLRESQKYPNSPALTSRSRRDWVSRRCKNERDPVKRSHPRAVLFLRVSTEEQTALLSNFDEAPSNRVRKNEGLEGRTG